MTSHESPQRARVREIIAELAEIGFALPGSIVRRSTVTLNTYAHLWPTAEDRTRTAAMSMLAEVYATADERLPNDDAA